MYTQGSRKKKLGQHLCRTHSRCSGKARHRGNSRASQFSENSGYTFRASSEHDTTGVCSSSAEFHCQTATSRHRCCHYLTLRAKLDAPDKKKAILKESFMKQQEPEKIQKTSYCSAPGWHPLPPAAACACGLTRSTPAAKIVSREE